MDSRKGPRPGSTEKKPDIFTTASSDSAMAVVTVEKAACSGCAAYQRKVDELQRVINRGAHQHADGMDLMREMQVRLLSSPMQPPG